MPISSRLRPAALGLAALALAACDPAGVSRGGISRVSVTVDGQPVTIAAPAGFCIDHESTRSEAAGAFVLVTDCQLLGIATSRPKPAAAVLTASVSPQAVSAEDAAAQLTALDAFFARPEGRAVLGRSGDPARTRVLARRARSGVLYLLVEDGGAQPVPGVAPRFWRAFLPVSNRMTALSVLRFGGSGEDAGETLGYLQGFADAIQAAEAAAAPVQPARGG